MAHRFMESSLVRVYKKQYDKVSVFLEFSNMSLGDWCLKFQVRVVVSSLSFKTPMKNELREL
jgi:hypothetical protein